MLFELLGERGWVGVCSLILPQLGSFLLGFFLLLLKMQVRLHICSKTLCGLQCKVIEWIAIKTMYWQIVCYGWCPKDTFRMNQRIFAAYFLSKAGYPRARRILINCSMVSNSVKINSLHIYKRKNLTMSRFRSFSRGWIWRLWQRSEVVFVKLRACVSDVNCGYDWLKI